MTGLNGLWLGFPGKSLVGILAGAVLAAVVAGPAQAGEEQRPCVQMIESWYGVDPKLGNIDGKWQIINVLWTVRKKSLATRLLPESSAVARNQSSSSWNSMITVA